MSVVREHAPAEGAAVSLRVEDRGPGGRVPAVLLAGEFDMETVPAIDAFLRRTFGPFFFRQHLLVDLDGVTFVDSSFISYVITLARRRRREGHELVLSGPRGQVRRALVTVGLPNLVPVYDALDEAAALIAGECLPLIPPPFPLQAPTAG
jgi:anti-anti-sigma factor